MIENFWLGGLSAWSCVPVACYVGMEGSYSGFLLPWSPNLPIAIAVTVVEAGVVVVVVGAGGGFVAISGCVGIR